MKISEVVQKLKSDTQHTDLVTLHIFLRLESRLKNGNGRVKVSLCTSLKYMESGCMAALIHNIGTRWK